jgi:hypothetical protein
LPSRAICGEVAAVLVECRSLARFSRTAGRLDAADHGAAKLRVRDAEAVEQLAGLRVLVVRQREQHVLRPDVRRAELARFVVRGE